MKRRELLRHLEKNGCQLKREGASHTIVKFRVLRG
jgi:predicted RNA binding protein YcfA (HicA-like mRNA interferase family)